MREKNYNWKKKQKNQKQKDTWETIDVITKLPLLGVKHCQSMIHMSKYWYIFIQQINKLIYLQLVI